MNTEIVDANHWDEHDVKVSVTVLFTLLIFKRYSCLRIVNIKLNAIVITSIKAERLLIISWYSLTNIFDKSLVI